jgi:hypothetical protein
MSSAFVTRVSGYAGTVGTSAKRTTMKTASSALINFLNQVIGFYDGQLVTADAFLFTLKSGVNLGHTNSEM